MRRVYIANGKTIDIRIVKAASGIVYAHGSPVVECRPSKTLCAAPMLASTNSDRGEAWKDR
jgi:hypothetical protein